MRWHRHGHGPIRQRDGLLVSQGIDRVESLALRAEHLVEGFPEILEQMKAVCDLSRRRCPVPCALGIGSWRIGKSKALLRRRAQGLQRLPPGTTARWRQWGKTDRVPWAGIAHTRRSASTSTARTGLTSPRVSSWP